MALLWHDNFPREVVQVPLPTVFGSAADERTFNDSLSLL